MKRTTQADRVLEYIKSHGSITSLEAVNNLGVIQLPRRIFDLKRRGHRIVREDKTTSNRFGESVRVGIYRLAP